MTEIVAELSGNHGGSLDNARQLIREAAIAGADAVKFQCFDPERLAARRAANPHILALAGGVPLVDLYRQTHTPREWFPLLIETARAANLAWFSSVFDPADVDFLEHFDCPRYKISAFEVLDWDIIKAVRETGKPVVMSVRPTPRVMILRATDYEGVLPPLGLSIHGNLLPAPNVPMAEYHLRLENVETPDSAFSLTPSELERVVRMTRNTPPVRRG